MFEVPPAQAGLSSTNPRGVTEAPSMPTWILPNPPPPRGAGMSFGITTGDDVADQERPKNYREVPLPIPSARVHRAAHPDALSAPAMACLGHRTVLDLRSPSERDPANWTQGWQVRDFVREGSYAEADLRAPNTLWRIDVLDADRLYDYLEAEWWTAQQRSEATMWRVFSGQELRRMQLRELNARGLTGLYEAILETSGPELRFCLELLTTAQRPVLVHCVKVCYACACPYICKCVCVCVCVQSFA